MASKVSIFFQALLAFLICGPAPARAQLLLGPEAPANAEHADEQRAPSMAIAQDGTGVLVFGGDVFNTKHVRWLDPAGSPVGPELNFNPDGGLGGLLFQDVAVGRKGQGVACWDESTAGFALCRRLDTAGGLGGAIRASEGEPGFGDREFGPSVDVFADGSFVVGWLDFDFGDEPFPGDLLLDPSLRFFSAAGEPAGPVVEVVQNEGGDFGSSDVAALAGGRAAFVWNGAPPGIGETDIFLSIAVPAGPLRSPVLVNSFRPGFQKEPSVASNAKDRLVVVWESEGQDGSGAGVFGRLFDGAGDPVGEEFQVSSDAATWQGQPVASMDRSGRFVVAFHSAYEEDDRAGDVLVRAYRADGTPLGPQVYASRRDIQPLDYPSLSLSDSGLVEVAFEAPWATADDPAGNFDVLHSRLVLPCVADGNTHCLAGGRFAVRAFWRTRDGAEDLATRIPLAADTGGFYFFDPTNFELLVKVLDGCAINDRFWVFAAGLTDVEVDVLVTDTFTGQVEVYRNPQGSAFAPVNDLQSFAGCGASAPAKQLAFAASAAPEAVALAKLSPAGLCVPTADTLCLAEGRYRVRATWTDFGGHSGPGQAMTQSAGSGLFYFFSPNNLELAVKVLDGCAINGRIWIFAAGLTDVGVTLEVEDLQGGGSWRRTNPLGSAFRPILDTSAFASCL